jgi:hypothetical protein
MLTLDPKRLCRMLIVEPDPMGSVGNLQTQAGFVRFLVKRGVSTLGRAAGRHRAGRVLANRRRVPDGAPDLRRLVAQLGVSCQRATSGW